MSFHDDPLQIRLSPRARLDLVGIFKHSGETWGEAQQLAYGRKVDDALRSIARNPAIGRPAREDGSWRLFRVRAHLIVYRVGTSHVEVLRVLHHRMQLADHLVDR
jgi:toxin ParE1/3/4